MPTMTHASRPDPATDQLILRGPRGLEVRLFGPRPLEDGSGVAADAVYVSKAIPKPMTLRAGSRAYRVPAIPGPACHIAHVTVKVAR